MSNDLIRRSAVLALVDKLGYVNCFDTKDYACNSRVDKIRQSIVELPAAYDLDRVVEQLEKEKNPIYREDGSLMAERRSLDINRAVKIVKAGGTN